MKQKILLSTKYNYLNADKAYANSIAFYNNFWMGDRKLIKKKMSFQITGTLYNLNLL